MEPVLTVSVVVEAGGPTVKLLATEVRLTSMPSCVTIRIEALGASGHPASIAGRQCMSGPVAAAGGIPFGARRQRQICSNNDQSGAVEGC